MTEQVLEPLLSSDEAAAILRVSRKTLYRLPVKYIHAGTGKKPLRRYRREDLIRFIQQRAA